MSQIHQELVFDASPAEVYAALIEPDRFAAFTGAEAEIDGVPGGAFLCFGTFISGRNIELVPGKRIVQAWRVFNWPEGVYSILRFELFDEGGKTRLVLDQDGVPEDAAGHVDGGWAVKYWTPLAEYFASRSG